MKKILVIGGSGQIGKVIVERYIKNNIVLNIDLKNLSNQKSENYFYVKKNLLNNPNNLKSYYYRLFEKFFYPEIVIDVSYLTGKKWNRSCFEEIDYKILKSNINSNLVVPIHNIISILNILSKEKKKANIVLFSSIYGAVSQDFRMYKNTRVQENVVYNMSKSSIIHFVKLAANYYIKKGIRINCISPGGIKGKNKSNNKSVSKILNKNYSLRSPIGRMADAKEVLSAVDFLISSDSTYVVGSNVVVDGGWTLI